MKTIKFGILGIAFLLLFIPATAQELEVTKIEKVNAITAFFKSHTEPFVIYQYASLAPSAKQTATFYLNNPCAYEKANYLRLISGGNNFATPISGITCGQWYSVSVIFEVPSTPGTYGAKGYFTNCGHNTCSAVSNIDDTGTFKVSSPNIPTPTCTSRYERRCVGNAVYFYDSCGNQESSAWGNCGSDSTCTNGVCVANPKPCGGFADETFWIISDNKCKQTIGCKSNYMQNTAVYDTESLCSNYLTSQPSEEQTLECGTGYVLKTNGICQRSNLVEPEKTSWWSQESGGIANSIWAFFIGVVSSVVASVAVILAKLSGNG